MLSYQHGYHAGNFADVFKHLGLILLINYLVQKDKPLFYLETHAGRGLYLLNSLRANKTAEYEQGIKLIWENRDSLPKLFAPYIKIIKALNPELNLTVYPGSPFIAQELLRGSDRAYFCELHPAEFTALKSLKNTKTFVSKTDGLSALNALLPPPEKRGLIFIDPSYEVKSDYKTIAQAINKAHSKFASGVYCLWYPIINQRNTNKLLDSLKNIAAKNTLNIELTLRNKANYGMYGCGLWIINPPYTFAQDMQLITETLKEYLSRI